MSIVVRRDEIEAALRGLDPVPLIEEGFAAYSRGETVVPPVGELLLEEPPGEVHLKYGYIRGDDVYVIKIASGFYRNPQLGLPSGQGLMLVFSQQTGALEAVLLDEGLLTDVRTAAAGAVVAKHLAPRTVRRIGIVGAGTQGCLQLRHLERVTSCREALVFDRDASQTSRLVESLAGSGFEVRVAASTDELAAECNLIVTATPSKRPLLRDSQIRTGTHITAVGSDTADKIELEPEILARASLVAVDSLSQSESRGEVFRAVGAGVLARERVVELGRIVTGEAPGRRDEEQITVCDLTGVAVQDIQIAKAVCAAVHAGRRDRE